MYRITEQRPAFEYQGKYVARLHFYYGDADGNDSTDVVVDSEQELLAFVADFYALLDGETDSRCKFYGNQPGTVAQCVYAKWFGATLDHVEYFYFTDVGSRYKLTIAEC